MPAPVYAFWSMWCCGVLAPFGRPVEDWAGILWEMRN